MNTECTDETTTATRKTIISSDITIINFESSEVIFPPRSTIKCTNGYLRFIGKVCSRSEKCPISNSICRDHCAKVLVEKLEACKLINEIIDILDDLIGGWAIIYYREDFKKVFVGRDVFGRKSLLWARIDGKFHFSVFAYTRKYNWFDIPPGTVTVFDLYNEENITMYYVFEVNGTWEDQFSKLIKVQRKLASERLMLSHELPSKKVCREVLAKAMLEQLKGALYRALCDVDLATKCISLSFSGGVDSLLIAHMIAQCLPSEIQFDLINVAFDKNKNYDGAPDRLQSKKAFRYLKSCYPERCIRLLLVNVDPNELAQCRKEYISSAVAPACSVLDDSIGCVQWFAARGEGFQFDVEGNATTAGKSQAKVVVVGSGADELFGGYMRHRTTYLRRGRKAVLEELYEELKRIGVRNLGRDDRIVLILDKDLRSPFLDDLFVEWVTSLPLECKTDFTHPRGIGEKWLVREALKLLDTPKVLFSAPKRAMQFGTKIAKLEQRGERGGDFCPRLLEEGV